MINFLIYLDILIFLLTIILIYLCVMLHCQLLHIISSFIVRTLCFTSGT